MIVRRAFHITADVDKRLNSLARKLKVEKSELVDWLLAEILPKAEEASMMEILRSIVERRLRSRDGAGIHGGDAPRGAIK